MKRIIGILIVLAFLLTGFSVVSNPGDVPAPSVSEEDETRFSIDTNRTWTSAGNPYVFSENVYVEEGITLTIEPGVIVQFTSGYWFYVGGNLVVNGSAASPVEFTTTQSPGLNRWQGFYINSTGVVDIHYANISYCYYGIFFYYSQLGLVTNTTFYWNFYGIYFSWADNIIIDNCVFDTQTGRGYESYYSDYFTIKNCMFIRTTTQYVSYIPYMRYSDYVTLYNNYYYDLNADFYIRQCDYISVIDETIDNCYYGFRFRGCRWGTFTGNTVSNLQNYRYSFMFDTGWWGYDYWNHDVSNNYVDGYPVLYYKDDNSLVIDNVDAASVYIVRCNGAKITDVRMNGFELFWMYESDNVNIDSCTLDNNLMYGFYLVYNDYMTINNTEIMYSNSYALYMYGCHWATITNNNLHDNSQGLYNSECHYGYYENDQFNNHNNAPFTLDAWNANSFDQTIIGCTIDGVPILSYNGVSNMVLTPVTGSYIHMYNCVNITMANFNMPGCWGGAIGYVTDSIFTNNLFAGMTSPIRLCEVDDCTFSYNTFRAQSGWALYLYSSDNVDFFGNDFVSGRLIYNYGLQVEYCDYLDIHDNFFNTYHTALYLYECDYNEVWNNEFLYSSYGIETYYTDYIHIHDNQFIENRDYGIYYRYNEADANISYNTFTGCQDYAIYFYYLYDWGTMTIIGNTFIGNASSTDRAMYFRYDQNHILVKDNHIEGFNYGLYFNAEMYDARFLYNGFVNNNVHVGDYSSNPVIFDDGSLGNWWADYVDVDADGDGIWDNPYIVSSYTQDNYPSTMQLPDKYPPEVTLIHPDNGFINNDDEIQFSIKDATLGATTYKIDSGMPVPFYYPFAISTFGWADAEYDINIVANDKYGHVTNQVFKVTVDSTMPIVNKLAPVTTEITAGTDIKFEISDDNIDTVTYSLNGAEPVAFSSPYTIKTGNWMTGSSYKVVVEATDLAGNSQKKTYAFTIVDGEKPVIALESPEDGAIVGQNDRISFSITDETLKNVAVNFDGAWIDFLNPYTLMANTLPEGPLTVQVQAWDNYGNTASASFDFTVDKSAPVVGLVSPQEGAVVGNGATFEFSVTDANLDNVHYLLNGIQYDMPSGNIITEDKWTDGPVKITVVATDKVGQSSSKAFLFTFDSIDPTVSSTNPTEGAAVKTVDVLRVVFSEAMDKDSVESAVTMSGQELTFSWLDKTLIVRFSGELDEGSYSLMISSSAQDLAGNFLDTFTLSFSISTDAVVVVGPDADEDGMPDDWEKDNDLDPTTGDADDDPDGDHLTNIEEFDAGTDPNNADTDGDGIPDQWETLNDLDPLDATDGAADRDGDGFSNNEEYLKRTDIDDASDHPEIGEKSSTTSWAPWILLILVILIAIGLFVLIFIKTRKDVDLDWAPEDLIKKEESVVAAAAEDEDEDEDEEDEDDELPPPPPPEDLDEEPPAPDELEDEDDLPVPDPLEPELISSPKKGKKPEQLKKKDIEMLPPASTDEDDDDKTEITDWEIE